MNIKPIFIYNAAVKTKRKKRKKKCHATINSLHLWIEFNKSLSSFARAFNRSLHIERKIFFRSYLYKASNNIDTIHYRIYIGNTKYKALVHLKNNNQYSTCRVPYIVTAYNLFFCNTSQHYFYIYFHCTYKY